MGGWVSLSVCVCVCENKNESAIRNKKQVESQIQSGAEFLQQRKLEILSPVLLITSLQGQKNDALLSLSLTGVRVLVMY